MSSKGLKDPNQVRLGMVNYINTAPIYEAWKRTVDDDRIQVIEKPPTVLNRMLAAGQIDLGFVSSYEYCARPSRYRILRDLSISSTGPVGSVFLFSQHPLEDLNQMLVLLSNQSETSVSLVKIILEEFHKVQPQYISGEVKGEMSSICQAVMAIGDDALRLASKNVYAYQFDLGEIWYEHTGLPFVFSICAIREEFCQVNPAFATKIQEMLLACRVQGRQEIENICRLVAPRIPMDCESCLNYLAGLEYDLDDTKVKALEKFFNYLIIRKEADQDALPLKFFPIG